jgi:hypothetical protein
MEAAGAVFLPAAGYRGGSSVYYAGSIGYYWSSSYASNVNDAYNVTLASVDFNLAVDNHRNFGLSVRLVCE